MDVDHVVTDSDDAAERRRRSQTCFFFAFFCLFVFSTAGETPKHDLKSLAATGLNNALWLMNNFSGNPAEVEYELDIVEAHFPNRVSTTVHFYGQEKSPIGALTLAPIDLSKSFNVYAILWEEDRLVFFLNGKQIWELKVSIEGALPVRFSTAVSRFAGPITDALDGTQMEVDWVRVYERPN